MAKEKREEAIRHATGLWSVPCRVLGAPHRKKHATVVREFLTLNPNPHIDGLNPDHGISSARPDITWPLSRHWEELHSHRVDEVLDMNLIETIAEHNAGHPQEWRDSCLSPISEGFPQQEDEVVFYQ